MPHFRSSLDAIIWCSRVSSSFLKTECYEANSLNGANGAIGRLRAGDIGAIVLRDVYPVDALSELPDLLDSNAF